MVVINILKDFQELKNENLAIHHTKFFKTNKNEYGEGDKFLGLTVPEVRTLSKKYYKLVSFQNLEETIKNEYHEIRLFTLFCLIQKINERILNNEFKTIVEFYIENIDYINNWDLVDLSSPYIIGKYCYLIKNYQIIKDFAKDKYNKNKKQLTTLWSQRISIISNLYLIRENKFDIAIELCEYFINHKHDLIHKASGWMLREIGKKDKKTLCNFLDLYHKKMPRTMLRYSIEKLSIEEKKMYMKK